MKNSPIILLCGQAGSGKDTIASMIKDIVPNTITLAQADPLKMLGKSLFQFTDDQLWGPSQSRNAIDERFNMKSTWRKMLDNSYAIKAWLDYCKLKEHKTAFFKWLYTLEETTFHKNNPLSPRTMLQTLGTEFGRSINPNIWSTIALDKAKERLANNQADLVVVTDGRFKNEILNAKMNNAMTVLIVNPQSATAKAREKTFGVQGHASEEELKTVPNYWFDHVFVNMKQFKLNYLKKEVQTFCDRNLSNEY